MDNAYHALGTPGVGFLAMLIVGAISGWLAEKISKSDHGILTNILVGIAGSFVGTRLAEVTMGSSMTGSGIGHVAVSTIGALLLIYGWRAVTGNRPM